MGAHDTAVEFHLALLLCFTYKLHHQHLAAAPPPAAPERCRSPAAPSKLFPNVLFVLRHTDPNLSEPAHGFSVLCLAPLCVVWPPYV